MSSSHEKLQEDRRRRRLDNIIWLLGLLIFAVAAVAGWNHGFWGSLFLRLLQWQAGIIYTGLTLHLAIL